MHHPLIYIPRIQRYTVLCQFIHVKPKYSHALILACAFCVSANFRVVLWWNFISFLTNNIDFISTFAK